MDKELLEKKLEKKSAKKGKSLKYKHIKKIAKKNDLTFEAVYDRAKELQGSGDLKIGSGVSGKVARKQGIYDPDPGMMKFLDGVPTYKDIKEGAGIDSDRLYKGYEQDKMTDAIREAGEKFERPQLSDEELFKRMEPNKETQRRLDNFEKNYGDRFGKKGLLKFDADGNKYQVKEPKWKNIGKIGDNEGAMQKVRDKMKTFEDGGGFQPVNMTTKKKNKYTSKGKDLLASIKI